MVEKRKRLIIRKKKKQIRVRFSRTQKVDDDEAMKIMEQAFKDGVPFDSAEVRSKLDGVCDPMGKMLINALFGLDLKVECCDFGLECGHH